MVSQHFTKCWSIDWSKIHLKQHFLQHTQGKIVCMFIAFKLSYQNNGCFIRTKQIAYYHFFFLLPMTFPRTKGREMFHSIVFLCKYNPPTEN